MSRKENEARRRNSKLGREEVPSKKKLYPLINLRGELGPRDRKNYEIFYNALDREEKKSFENPSVNPTKTDYQKIRKLYCIYYNGNALYFEAYKQKIQ
jgi:hypothetical protein